MATPFVLIAEPLAAGPLAWLAERAEVVTCPPEDPRFGGLLARADGLIVRTRTRVTPELLGAAPRLRVVGRAGVGVDHIDLLACRARGVRVVHTPGANTQAVVQFVWAEVLSALRPVAALIGPLDPPAWEAARVAQTAPLELGDLTLGIYGLGRIGSGVARVGAAFGMTILYCDLLEIEDACGAVRVGREELLARSDVLTLHVDGRPQNRGLINAGALALCKPALLLVNTARGPMVDAAALADFLRVNPGARAVVDVFDPEPLEAGCPLLELPNARLTPHIAAATGPAKERMSWVVTDVWRVLEGHDPAFAAV